MVWLKVSFALILWGYSVVLIGRLLSLNDQGPNFDEDFIYRDWRD